jgi:hypothetical protein
MPNIAGQEYFEGTLFRLPFRSTTDSKIAPGEAGKWDESRTRESLAAFSKDIGASMIFLKNVKKVEISVWQPNATKPTVLYSASSDVPASSQENYESWKNFLSSKTMVRQAFRLRDQTQAFAKSYRLNVHVSMCSDEEILGEMPQPRMGALRVGLSSSRKEALKQTHYEFVVSQRIGTDSKSAMDFAIKKTLQQKKLQNQSQITKLTVIPKTGVAFLIAANGLPPSRAALMGRAFVTLPLPSRLGHGLPVHINGSWELDKARTTILANGSLTDPLNGAVWNKVSFIWKTDRKDEWRERGKEGKSKGGWLELA